MAEAKDQPDLQRQCFHGLRGVERREAVYDEDIVTAVDNSADHDGSLEKALANEGE